MNRRDFLINMLGATAVASLPTATLTPFLKGETHTIQWIDDWLINYTTKTIEYVGKPNPNGVTQMELYRLLKDQWKEAEDCAIIINNGDYTCSDEDKNIIRSGGWIEE